MSANLPYPQKKAILIVDDDEDICLLLSTILSYTGYQIHTARNGQEALKYLRSQPIPPSLILLDLMMPVMNGWEFREAQRQDPNLAAIPVVILSADNNLAKKLATSELTKYLVKPVELDSLLDTVASYCHLRYTN